MLKERWDVRMFPRRRGWPFAAMLTAAVTLLLVRGYAAFGQDATEQLFREARAAVQKRDFALAEQKYLEVTRRAPHDHRAYHDLGVVYLRENKYEEAITVLEKAVDFDPEVAATRVLLGQAYYESHQPSKAVAVLQQALRMKPDDPETRLYLGKAQFDSGDYQAAADNLGKLAEKYPTPEVIQALTLAYEKRTMAEISRQGKFAPHSFEELMVLALEAKARGDADAALSHYRQALKAKPNAVGVHYAMGNVLVSLFKLDEATQEFKKEVALNPKDALALWKLGALTLHSDPERARQYLERSVSLNPQRAGPYVAYGRALVLAGDTPKAVQEYLRAEQLEPQSASAHYLLAGVYRRLGRKEDADGETAQFERLTKLDTRRQAHAVAKLLASQEQYDLLELDSASAPAVPSPSSASSQDSARHP
ncbi:MAG TPA: tetratricopeptide repeat protein [Terriglobia bacterium]|nr:tetratricopeptide repeat protein [Terriglobia bacterium]